MNTVSSQKLLNREVNMEKDFLERFGIEVENEEAIEMFMARTRTLIFNKFRLTPGFVWNISVCLGENWDRYIQELRGYQDYVVDSNLTLDKIVKGDFKRCLNIIELIYGNSKDTFKSEIDKAVIFSLKRVTIKSR